MIVICALVQVWNRFGGIVNCHKDKRVENPSENVFSAVQYFYALHDMCFHLHFFSLRVWNKFYRVIFHPLDGYKIFLLFINVIRYFKHKTVKMCVTTHLRFVNAQAMKYKLLLRHNTTVIKFRIRNTNIVTDVLILLYKTFYFKIKVFLYSHNACTKRLIPFCFK